MNVAVVCVLWLCVCGCACGFCVLVVVVVFALVSLLLVVCLCYVVPTAIWRLRLRSGKALDSLNFRLGEVGCGVSCSVRRRARAKYKDLCVSSRDAPGLAPACSTDDGRQCDLFRDP